MRSRLVVLALLSGCQGGGVVPQSRVTAQLKEACYWLDENEIEALLQSVDTSVANGLSEAQWQQSALNVCVNDINRTDCQTCFFLAGSAVYD